MLIKNKTNAIFRQGGIILYPHQTEDVPEAFANHPVVASMIRRGLIEKVGETTKPEVAPEIPEIPEETPEEPEMVKPTPKKRKKAE